MAHLGQTLENPVTGERFVVRETAATSGGELLAFDFLLRPGGAVPIAHVHPLQEERFEVVSGTMRFRTGWKTFEAGPGESVVVAPGVPHSFANAGSVEAALRIEVRPALRMEEMLETVVGLARAGFMNRRGLPRNPLRLAALALEFAQEAHAPYLPRELQRALLAPFAHFGRQLPTAPCSSRPLPLKARPA